MGYNPIYGRANVTQILSLEINEISSSGHRSPLLLSISTFLDLALFLNLALLYYFLNGENLLGQKKLSHWEHCYKCSAAPNTRHTLKKKWPNLAQENPTIFDVRNVNAAEELRE